MSWKAQVHLFQSSMLQTGLNRSPLPLLVAFLDRFGCCAGLLVCHVRCYLVEYGSVILLNYRSSASKSALSIPAGKLQCIQRYLTIFASMGKDLAIASQPDYCWHNSHVNGELKVFYKILRHFPQNGCHEELPNLTSTHWNGFGEILHFKQPFAWSNFQGKFEPILCCIT